MVVLRVSERVIGGLTTHYYLQAGYAEDLERKQSEAQEH